MIIPPLAFHRYTFSCPGASASTYRTMFNTGSGIRHPYFVGSMTLNNPWNPAWLCILQKLRGEKKKEGEYQTANIHSGMWGKQKQGNYEEGKAFL